MEIDVHKYYKRLRKIETVNYKGGKRYHYKKERQKYFYRYKI